MHVRLFVFFLLYSTPLCVSLQDFLFVGLSFSKILGILYTCYATKCRSGGSVRLSAAFQHGNRTTHEILWLHIARSAPDEDHHRAVAAAICKPPSDWKQPPGRPNHTWLTTVSDLRPPNIGPSYAWKKAASREHWRSKKKKATVGMILHGRGRRYCARVVHGLG